jgi:hypothetical protein
VSGVEPQRTRWLVAWVVCVGLPLGSWLFADGALAYTMFTATVTYRLEVHGHGADGHASAIAPTELARFAGPFAAPFLFGAEAPRELPQIAALRAHLADIGRLACAHSDAARVDVLLFEGTDPRAAASRAASVRCEIAP